MADGDATMSGERGRRGGGRRRRPLGGRPAPLRHRRGAVARQAVRGPRGLARRCRVGCSDPRLRPRVGPHREPAHGTGRRRGVRRRPARRATRAASGPSLHRVCRCGSGHLRLLRAPVGSGGGRLPAGDAAECRPARPPARDEPDAVAALRLRRRGRRARGLRREPHVVAPPLRHRHRRGTTGVGAHRPQRRAAGDHGAALPRRAGGGARAWPRSSSAGRPTSSPSPPWAPS